MPNQQKIDYLNKISQDNRSVAQSPLSSFSINPKIIKRVLIGFGIFIAIVLAFGWISSITNRDTTRSRDLVDQISTRATNLETTLETYQDKIRNTELRANIINLETFLNTTISNIDTVVMNGNYGEPNPAIVLSEERYIAGLNATLEDARLNVSLESTLRREIKKETQILMSLEKECLGRSDDNALKSVLTSSYSDLSSIVDLL
ncbi:MAG: hypothetical protein Q4F60_02520 [Candidatus Saccharibacteria bacterium]|nr:hypothetical protein [Candidatus Saccharibacteria bacterium]